MVAEKTGPIPTRVLITGGAGFIGSAVVREIIDASGSNASHVINLDKLTYAGNTQSLAGVDTNSRYHFAQVDICDSLAMTQLFREQRPTAVMHLAAETHVDRSIHGPQDFIDTNVVGSYKLLEVACAYWRELSGDARDTFRFHHISTDEVYGDLDDDAPAFTENSPYKPSSPYSASKAASDHLVRAWHRTYGLPVVVSNCSNNYGPCQFPEKLIPLMIMNALDGKPLPIYGSGSNIRDWLYVEDHARALLQVLHAGAVGHTYNIGGNAEHSNLEVVQRICAILDRLVPAPAGDYARLIQFVPDRPGHDRRYAIDSSLITRELGWAPVETFASGLEKTVRWYLDNPDWVQNVRSGAYREWLQRNYGDRQANKAP